MSASATIRARRQAIFVPILLLLDGLALIAVGAIELPLHFAGSLLCAGLGGLSVGAAAALARNEVGS